MAAVTGGAQTGGKDGSVGHGGCVHTHMLVALYGTLGAWASLQALHTRRACGWGRQGPRMQSVCLTLCSRTCIGTLSPTACQHVRTVPERVHRGFHIYRSYSVHERVAYVPPLVVLRRSLTYHKTPGPTYLDTRGTSCPRC